MTVEVLGRSRGTSFKKSKKKKKNLQNWATVALKLEFKVVSSMSRGVSLLLFSKNCLQNWDTGLHPRWMHGGCLNNCSVPCQCSVEVVINLHTCCVVVCLHYTIVSPRHLRGGILRTQKSILSVENRTVPKASHATNDIYNMSVRLSTRNTKKY